VLEGAGLSAPKYLGHDGACPSKIDNYSSLP
jgi:hypothetical protein